MKTQRLYNKRLNSYAIWNGSAWEDKNISGAYFYTLEKAANNGYYPVKEKSDREKAIEWWNNISEEDKRKIVNSSEFRLVVVNGFCWATSFEIEEIWRKETQQKSLIESQADEVEEIAFKNLLRKEKRPQVDFELLHSTIDMIDSYPVDEDVDLNKLERVNLKLFFELLSKSSTFAHKAHKELNKLSNK